MSRPRQMGIPGRAARIARRERRARQLEIAGCILFLILVMLIAVMIHFL